MQEEIDRLVEIQNCQVAMTRVLSGEIVALRARCDGLEITAWFSGEKQQIPCAETSAMVEKITAASHQCQLDQMESMDPAGAAALDTRKLNIDLDPDLVRMFRGRYPLHPHSEKLG